jgi:hypothetical protein
MELGRALPQPTQRSCAVVGTAAVAVAKVATAISAVRVFVIRVSLSVGSIFV